MAELLPAVINDLHGRSYERGRRVYTSSATSLNSFCFSERAF